jgi:hypothetical protein
MWAFLSFAAILEAEPLARFDVQERLELESPRTLVTYRVNFSAGQAQPGKVRLEESLGKEVTTREATDYVFVNRAPMTVAQGEVSFDGAAGMVRVYAREFHLIQEYRAWSGIRCLSRWICLCL